MDSGYDSENESKNSLQETFRNTLQALHEKKYLNREDIDTLEWISRDHAAYFFQNKDQAGAILVKMTTFLNGPPPANRACSKNGESKFGCEDRNLESGNNAESQAMKRTLLRILTRLAACKLGHNIVQLAMERLTDSFDMELSEEDFKEGVTSLNGISFLLLVHLGRSSGKEIQALDVLNLANWDIRRALSILTAALILAKESTPASENESEDALETQTADIVVLGKCLNGLTLPATWVASSSPLREEKKGEDEEYNWDDIAVCIDRLVQEGLSLQVVEVFSGALGELLENSGTSSKILGAVGWTLQAVYNLFVFSKASTALRGALSTHQTFTTGLTIPYIKRCLALLEQSGQSPPALHAVLLGLKLLVLVGFRQNVLPCLRPQRDALREEVRILILQIFSCNREWTEGASGNKVLILILILISNLDLLGSIEDGIWEIQQRDIIVTLRLRSEGMSGDQKNQVLNGLELPNLLPVCRQGTSFRTVWAMFARFNSKGDAVIRKWAQEFMANIFSSLNIPRESFIENYSRWEAQHTDTSPGSKEKPSQIETLEKKLSAKELLSCKQSVEDYESDEKSSANESKADRKVRLLGDLPPLMSTSKAVDSFALPFLGLEDAKRTPGYLKKLFSKDEHKSAAAVEPIRSNIPEEFLCSINRHVMKEPMKSPHGFWFEKETIQLWLQKHGSVCPISHQELQSEELLLDTDLQEQIFQWKIRASISKSTSTGDDLVGDNLYAF